jgi:hypothetical protein
VGWLGFCRSMGSEGWDGYILFFEGILGIVQNTYVFYTLIVLEWHNHKLNEILMAFN